MFLEVGLKLIFSIFSRSVHTEVVCFFVFLQGILWRLLNYILTNATGFINMVSESNL